MITGLVQGQTPLYPNYPSETPEKFQPSTGSFNYVKRDEMIAMRDGVTLRTIFLWASRMTDSCPLMALVKQ